jgi:hypothetical protein
MKGPLSGSVRVMVLTFSAMKLQQWLLCASARLIAIGYLVPAGVGRVFVALGLLLTVAPLLFAGGALLRYFIAPRAMRFIPRAREQMLAGMALTIVVIATAATLAFWSFGYPPERLLMVWLRVATVSSVLLLSQFLLVTSVPGMTLWFVALGGGASMLQAAPMRTLLATIGSNIGLMAAIILIAWSAFAGWFLRVRSFKSPHDRPVHGTGVVKVQASHGAAIRAFLFGNPSVRYQFAGGFMAALLVGGLWTVMAVTLQTVHSVGDAIAKFAGPAFALGAYAGIGGFTVVRRSKVLWLRGGIDRNGLLRLCEGQAWRFFGATAVPLVVLLAIDWVSNPERGVTDLVLLLFQLSVGACLLYLGLMHVRGWRVLDVVCALLLAGVWLMTFPIMGTLMERGQLVFAVFGAMAAFAIGLRFAAAHRWRRIDWLVCRPAKLTPRGLPAAS